MKKKGSVKLVVIYFIVFLMLSIPFCFSMELNLTYDGNGNLITGDEKYREYNGFNQLIKVYRGDSDSGDILEEYIWHPVEERVLLKKVHLKDRGGPQRVIAYVNDNFVREYNVEDSGVDEINDTYYINDGTGIVAEIMFSGTEDTPSFTEEGTLYYHNDHLGSTSAITNESGDLVEETFYGPYGEILDGGEVSRYDYEGKEFSSITEDYDFHFRKYDPKLMIFTQPDSGVQNVYDPQNLNRYTFERNNPYKYVDPDGKMGILVIAGGISVIALVAYGLEFYHGLREDASFSSIHEAGASRSGQELGEALFFESEPKFIAGLGLPYYSGHFLTGLEAIEEISSGRKSSFLNNGNTNNLRGHSANIYNAPLICYQGYNQFSQSNIQIDIAQQSTVLSSRGEGSSSSGGTTYSNYPSSSSNNGGSSSGRNSFVNSVKSTVSRVVNSVKNFFGRFFR